MSITPTASDPLGLGTDVALLGDLNPVWGLVSGFTNLGYALARRLNATLGSLAPVGDAAYGENLSDLLNQGLTPADVARKSQAVVGQCRLDERVQTCRVSFVLVPQTGALTINVTGTTPSGAPFAFQFIVDPTTVTVSLLSVNGVAVAQGGTAVPAAASSTTTVIIQGGSSGPGPAGPPGPAGGASESVPIADVESDLGTEDPQPQTQKEVNWGALPASITITLNGMFSSASGSSVFHVRINGSDNLADGTIVATITASSPSATSSSGGSTITNPGGLGRLIVTADSSGAGVDCAGRNMTLTVR